MNRTSPDAPCHRVLGLVCEQLVETSSAVMHLERAIALDPAIGRESQIQESLRCLKSPDQR